MNLDDLHHPSYLGDSVYCGVFRGMIVLGTCNDSGSKMLQNVIYMELETMYNLLSYYKELQKKGA